jgi:hypothetical protein
MSLLNKASFLVTPNGYKEDKLYAAIPTNGNGDMTFTRESTATRVDENDLVSSVASNVPRIDYTDEGCPSILLEPQRTNLVKRSQEFDNASWLKYQVSVTANALTAPDGTLTADLATVTSDSANRLNQAVAVTASTTYTFSFYAKAGTLETSKYSVYDLTNSAYILSPVVYSMTGEWQRITLTFTTPVECTNIWIYTSHETASGTYYVWGAQVEAGAYPTSYIPTTTATVTRLKDECTNGGNADLFNDSEGTVFVDLENFDTPQTELTLSSGFSTNRITFLFYGSAFGNPNKIRFYLASAGSAQVDSVYNISYTFNQRNKIAFKYKQNDFKIYINGTQVFSDISGSTPIGLSRFDFAQFGTTSGFIEGKINQAMVFNEALSDSELKTLTTL